MHQIPFNSSSFLKLSTCFRRKIKLPRSIILFYFIPYFDFPSSKLLGPGKVHIFNSNVKTSILFIVPYNHLKSCDSRQFTNKKMKEAQSIGAIKVKSMILAATALTLGSLVLCWLTTSVKNPTIMQSAMEYPYTIIFRICMMYSLFITFLELLFIKWWIDSFPIYNHTSKMVFAGAVGLAAYGLFVSCIDRKRINYALASDAVAVSSIGMAISIFLIMKNLSANRSQGVALASESSWFYKRLFSILYGAAFVSGVLMYSGYLSIDYKPIVEYASVISCSLFFWSFTIEFKKFKMDVERFDNPKRQVLEESSTENTVE